MAGAGSLNISQAVSTYGYVVVALFIALEGMGLPLPGEVVLLSAAALAAQGKLAIVGVVLAAWVGTIVGGSGGYWIGRTGGIAVIGRFGRWFGLNHERELWARAFFERHGAKTVIIARFVAILRMIAGILAGVACMSFATFTLCNAVGGLVWSAVFGALGYLFGRNLPLLEHYMRRSSVAVLVAIVLALLGLWWWQHRKARETIT